MAKTGRPPLGDTYQRVRMTKDQQDEMDLIAAVLGISRAEVVRRALALGLAEMKQESAA